MLSDKQYIMKAESLLEHKCVFLVFVFTGQQYLTLFFSLIRHHELCESFTIKPPYSLLEMGAWIICYFAGLLTLCHEYESTNRGGAQERLDVEEVECCSLSA